MRGFITVLSYDLYLLQSMLDASATCSVDSGIVILGVVYLAVVSGIFHGLLLLPGELLVSSVKAGVFVAGKTSDSLALKGNWVGKVRGIQKWVSTDSSTLTISVLSISELGSNSVGHVGFALSLETA